MSLPAKVMALEVAANITSDTTWSFADSPININLLNFEVENGVTLTVEPGVTVHVLEGGTITITGTLIATGTADQNVVFSSRSGTWESIDFTSSTCSPHDNRISYTQFNNLSSNFTSNISVSNTNLTLTHSAVTASGSSDYLLRTYAGHVIYQCEGSLTLLDNTFHFTTDVSNYRSAAIYIDGTDLNLNNNTITAISSGHSGIAGVYLDSSNTLDYEVSLDSNNISVQATQDMEYSYGIYFRAGASGDPVNNTLNIQGRWISYGIYKSDGTISGNHITLNSDDETAFYTYGIYSTASSSASSIVNNEVIVTAVNGYIYGIHGQAGTMSGNSVIGHLNLLGTYGMLLGIYNRYYSATLKNNSVFLDTTSRSSYLSGISIGIHYAQNDLTIKNNVLMGDNSPLSTGIYSGSENVSVANTYNLIYQFVDTYYGASEGVGDIYGSPLFLDENSDLHLQSGSPAIDAGDWADDIGDEPTSHGGRINMGAYGGRGQAQNSSVEMISPQILTNHGEDYTTSNAQITLSGRVSRYTEFLEINGSLLDEENYVVGETSWTYTTRLDLGENTFSFVAIDSELRRSEVSEITVRYVDATVPYIDSKTPAEDATHVSTNSSVAVRFSEAMDEESFNESTFYLDHNIRGEIVYRDQTVIFIPHTSLDYNTTYLVTLTTGIQDRQGNPLEENYTWSFTTQQNEQLPSAPSETFPQVRGTLPSYGAQNVSRNASIDVTFSGEVDENTLHPASFIIVPEVEGVFNYESGVASFIPKETFEADQTYTITLTTQIKDLEGNAMNSNYSWSFTTALSEIQIDNIGSSGGCILSEDDSPISWGIWIGLGFIFGLLRLRAKISYPILRPDLGQI